MQLDLTENTFTITLVGMERLWACKLQNIVIDRTHIQSVSLEEPELTFPSLRAPGTSVPTYFHAGTFYSKLGKEFWYFKPKEPKMTLILSDGPYKRIIIAPENMEEWYDKLNTSND
jgi:hypothetical protein